MQRPPEGGLAEFSGEIGSEIDAAFFTPRPEKPQGLWLLGEFIDAAMLDIARKAAWNPENDRGTRLDALRYFLDRGEARS